MDYRDAIKMKIDAYYREVIEKYKVTTTVAMKAAKKFTFKKRDFNIYIEGFKNHKEDASEFLETSVEIPENDFTSKELVDKLTKSINSFITLCDRSMKFYEITDRKQYRDSGIAVDDYKLAFGVMQEALVDAMEDLNDLDKAYRKYAPEKFADKD